VCQISSSSFSFLIPFQFPPGENAGQPISFVLKNQPQPPAAIRDPIQDVNISKAPFIATKGVLVEKAFLGFIRLDAVITQMLDISVFLALIIPFKLVPAISRHGSVAYISSSHFVRAANPCWSCVEIMHINQFPYGPGTGELDRHETLRERKCSRSNRSASASSAAMSASISSRLA
jgi:hypothetical protein